MKLKKTLSILAGLTLVGALSAQVPVVPKGKSTEKLRINGRIQFQYQNMSSDVSGPSYAGVGDNSSQNGFYFRRLFLGAKANLAQNFYGEIVADFGGTDSNVDIDKAVIGWTEYSQATVMFGRTKVPFGYEETTSSSKLKTIERSIANRLFADVLDLSARRDGIFVEGDIEQMQGLSYALSFGNNQQDRTQTNTDANNGFSSFARLQYDGDSDYGSYIFGVNGGIVTDHMMGGDTNLIGAYSVWNWENFRLFAEFQGADIENGAAVNDDAFAYGYTIQPSYKFNDEFEAVVSYSVVNTNGAYDLDSANLVRRANTDYDAAPNDGDDDTFDDGYSIYVGGNWYIMGNDVKLGAGYEYAEFESTTASASDKVEISGLRAQMQILF